MLLGSISNENKEAAKEKKMTGFTITMDAVVALILAGGMIASCMSLVSQESHTQLDYISEYCYDFLTVAEKSGAIDKAIDGEKELMNSMMLNSPSSICIKLDIIGDKSALSLNKSCAMQENRIVAERVVWMGGVYLARITCSYSGGSREEGGQESKTR